MTSVNNFPVTVEQTNNQNDKLRNTAIGCAGAIAGYEADYYLKNGVMSSIRNKIKKEIIKVQTPDFKQYVNTAIKQNKLEDGFKIIDLNPNTVEDVKKALKINLEPPTGITKFFGHVLRLPLGKNVKSFNETLKGQNAFFSPIDNAVVCNFDKFGAPLFHEVTHKLNDVSPNPIIKTLAKIRSPLAAFVPTMISMTAMLTDPKEKNGEDKKGFAGFVKKHCGILAAGAMLPLTIEECIANIKGTKVAEKAGVTGDLLKKVKHLHKMSIISYCSSLVATGLAVHFGNKLRDYICSKRTDKAAA